MLNRCNSTSCVSLQPGVPRPCCLPYIYSYSIMNPLARRRRHSRRVERIHRGDVACIPSTHVPSVITRPASCAPPPSAGCGCGISVAFPVQCVQQQHEAQRSLVRTRLAGAPTAHCAHGRRLSLTLPWMQTWFPPHSMHRSLRFPWGHAVLFPRGRLFFAAAMVGVPDAPRAVGVPDARRAAPRAAPASPAPLAPRVAPAPAPAPLASWIASVERSVAESRGPDCATPLAPPFPLASVSPRTCAPPCSRGPGRVRLRCPARLRFFCQLLLADSVAAYAVQRTHVHSAYAHTRWPIDGTVRPCILHRLQVRAFRVVFANAVEIIPAAPGCPTAAFCMSFCCGKAARASGRVRADECERERAGGGREGGRGGGEG